MNPTAKAERGLIDEELKKPDSALLNWPPSRGRKNPCPPVKFTPGHVMRYIGYEDKGLAELPGPPSPWGVLKEKLSSWQLRFGWRLHLLRVRLGLQGKPKVNRKWRLNYHVASVAGLTLDQAVRLLKGKGEHHDWDDRLPTPRIMWSEADYRVDLSYPLSQPVTLFIQPMKRSRGTTEYSVGYILWMVAREYRRIYKAHRKFGVWGHAMTDLYFERLTVVNTPTHNRIILGIGS